MNTINEEVTIYDVAREANVSTATVSRVINGYASVTEETRSKVLSIVDAMNYHPNLIAQQLVNVFNKTKR